MLIKIIRFKDEKKKSFFYLALKKWKKKNLISKVDNILMNNITTIYNIIIILPDVG